MKLVSVRVKNYKCIDDSEEFSIRILTCLAGKNESGKTALLQALRRLNPVEDSENQFDALMEYPRRRFRAQSGDPSGREVLTTIWQLCDDDISVIEGIVGLGAIQDRTVTVSKGYDNRTVWEFQIDVSKVVPFVASEVPELSESAKAAALKHSTLEELHSNLESLESPNEGESLLLQYIEERFPENNPRAAVSTSLQGRLPRFLYFPTYGTLPGTVQVEQIVKRAQDENSQTEDDRFFLALLALAETTAEDLQQTRRYEERKARLEAVSNHLSDEIFEYWTQNRDLAVEFDHDEANPDDQAPFDSGHIFSLRVRNNRHRASVSFDERSAGFVWFFSFLVWFSQMERIYGHRLIILLDEPGLSLHGKAQGDLLRYIKDKLLPRHQVIYTTHSPFMIDAEDILSVRTVEDSVSEHGIPIGTKVGDRVLSADSDTLFPLRAALGYDITQTLFVGEHCLLVEGPSDLLYLKWASRQLAKKGRTRLDTRWTVTPVGGLDKVASFVALFAGNELRVAVLADFHSGDKGKVQRLRELEILESGHVFTADSFAGQDEADIEDMLGRDMYLDLINRCYDLEGGKRLPSVQPDNVPVLVLEEVKQHFRTVATQGPEFDHLSPAVYLVEHEREFDNADGLEIALDRFEKFFRRVNSLLP